MLAEIEAHLYSVSKPKSLSQIIGLEKTAVEFCASLILRYLETNGVQTKQGQKISIDECLSQLKIQPRFNRMFQFFLNLLSQIEITDIRDSSIFFLEPKVVLLSPEEYLKKIRTLYPKFHLFFSFLEKCAHSYSETLSGRKHATEVLFPSDNPFLLKKIYENTPKLGHEDIYLHLAKEFLRNRLGKSSKLIEIGGGQGILTQILLPELHEHLENYQFTDIGTSFIREASVQWSHRYPKLSTAIFDASRDPTKQGFELESFDALVGFNVVHATNDIAQTLEQSTKLIRKGGVICLIETVRQQVWIDMIYGITDGWWLFNDSIRTNSPLLTIEQWEKTLIQYGCNHPLIFPTDKAKRIETDTALIIIERPEEQ